MKAPKTNNNNNSNDKKKIHSIQKNEKLNANENKTTCILFSHKNIEIKNKMQNIQKIKKEIEVQQIN